MKYGELSRSPSYFKWHWPPDQRIFDLEKFLRDELEVHDADNCGDSHSIWVVQDFGPPKYYHMFHTWWIEDSRSGYEDWAIRNSFEFEEITRDDITSNNEKIGDKYDLRNANENLKCVL